MTQTTHNPHVIAQDGAIVPTGEPEQESEQLQDSGVYALVAPLRQSDAPLHLQMFDLVFDAPAEVKEAVAEAYFGDAVPLKKFLAEHPGEDVPVLGMCIYEQGPYKAKAEPHPMMPGYLQVRILTGMKERGRHIVIKSSSKGIAQHAFFVLKNRGWFLFEDVQTYRFTQSGESGAHAMYNVAHDLEKALKRGKTAK